MLAVKKRKGKLGTKEKKRKEKRKKVQKERFEIGWVRMSHCQKGHLFFSFIVMLLWEK
jgi:hypothetical protein